ncbi:MAG: YkvA family protein [Defluviicoccus sp.]
METRLPPIDISRALVPAPGHERLVHSRLWAKVKRTLGRAPFLDRALAAFFAAVDANTPSAAKATLFAALAYFILPVDLVPDFIAGIGFSDDAAVLLLALQAIAPHIMPEHLDKARQALANLAETRDG